MSPTFNEIWFAKEWTGRCSYHPQTQYARSRRYFRIRSVVRLAFWLPIAAYMYSLFLAAL